MLYFWFEMILSFSVWNKKITFLLSAIWYCLPVTIWIYKCSKFVLGLISNDYIVMYSWEKIFFFRCLNVIPTEFSNVIFLCSLQKKHQVNCIHSPKISEEKSNNNKKMNIMFCTNFSKNNVNIFVLLDCIQHNTLYNIYIDKLLRCVMGIVSTNI